MSKTYSEHKKNLKDKADKKKTRSRKTRTKKVKTKGKSNPKKVAEKTLKENLKQEFQVSLTLDGSTDYVAGGIIELDKSFGKFEGKYVIDKVTHNITGDYSCDIEAMKIGAREEAVQNSKVQTEKEQQQKKANKKKGR